MLRVLSLFVIAACAGRQPSPPPRSGIDWPDALDHASTPATHREAALLALDSSGAQGVMAAMIDVALEAQLRQNPILKPYESVLRKFLTKYLSYDAIRDELAQAYIDRFDELQLRQIAAFYRTPTGKLAVSKLPELTHVGGQLGRRRVEEHQAELVDMLRQAQQNQAPEP